MMIEDGIYPIDDNRSRKDISNDLEKMDPAFARSVKRNYRKIRRRLARMKRPAITVKKDVIRDEIYTYYVERARIFLVNKASGRV